MADARVILQRRPEGQVGIADFAVVPVEIAPLAAGEALVAPARISLDPYLAIQVYGRPVRGVTLEPGEAMRSRMVGTVVESRDPASGRGRAASRFPRRSSNGSTRCATGRNCISARSARRGSPPGSGCTAWRASRRARR